MATDPPHRAPRDILAELKQLQLTSSDSRDRLSILHELSVYQEELIVQNEALTHAQHVLEDARDRFIELYDFAPNGYLTLDEHGVVRLCNLTAAAMIGRSKPALEGMPFLGFVVPADRSIYVEFLRQCRRSGVSSVETELSLRTADGIRHVQLLARVRRGPQGGCECFTAVIDVTERRRLEHERERNTHEREALTGRLITAQDDERLRIARNLHDDVGQQVTALRLKVEAMAGGLRQVSIPEAVGQLQEMLRELDLRVHFVASELRPAALDLGIVAALDQFVHDWSATYSVPAVFRAEGIAPGTLTPHIETHLYRIAQEALNNAAKHAAAHQVTVRLEDRDGGVVLVVEDDGCGFDLEARRQRGDTIGLVGMRERTQIIGGRLEVETAPGNGTSIYVFVPHDALD